MIPVSSGNVISNLKYFYHSMYPLIIMMKTLYLDGIDTRIITWKYDTLCYIL